MDFSVCEYTVLPISMKCNASIFQYAIFGETPDHVDDHDYLEVTISHFPCWEKHCNEISNRLVKLLDCYTTLYPNDQKK